MSHQYTEPHKYGVIVSQPYETWMDTYSTLKEARRAVREMEERTRPWSAPRITLVRIMSHHIEGSRPKPEEVVEDNSTTYKQWLKEVTP